MPRNGQLARWYEMAALVINGHRIADVARRFLVSPALVRFRIAQVGGEDFIASLRREQGEYRVRTHDTATDDCWCAPVKYAICPECDGAESGCWHCEGDRPGLVPAVPDSDPLIVVHVSGDQ